MIQARELRPETRGYLSQRKQDRDRKPPTLRAMNLGTESEGNVRPRLELGSARRLLSRRRLGDLRTVGPRPPRLLRDGCRGRRIRGRVVVPTLTGGQCSLAACGSHGCQTSDRRRGPFSPRRQSERVDTKAAQSPDHEPTDDVDVRHHMSSKDGWRRSSWTGGVGMGPRLRQRALR